MDKSVNTQLPQKAQEAAAEDLQKIATNPNPRANANIQGDEGEQPDNEVGEEITDGEAG